MSEDQAPAEDRWERREVVLARVPRPRPGGRQPVLDRTLAVIYARALRSGPP